MRVRTTIILDERINKVMREVLPANKGEISKFINEAIKEKLERMGLKVGEG